MFTVTCLDTYGNVITNLTQWDIDQSLTIIESGLTTAPEFHFCNKNSKEALVVPSTLSNGTITVKIPNILLQESTTIIAYIYAYTSTTSGKTLATIRIPVRPRPQPSDYNYIENIEYVSAVALEQHVSRELEKVSSDYEFIAISIEEINNKLSKVTDGSPKGAFESVEDLTDCAPGVYLNSTDGWIYYWDGSVLSEGICQYLSTGGSVSIDKTLTIENMAADAKVVGDIINDIKSQIADITYEPISITSFSHNVGIKEIGSTVDTVTLSWKINKTPTSLKLDGQSIDVNSSSKAISGLSITANNNKTWELIATDEKNSVNKTTTITFTNGIYYGVGSQESNYDSTFITSLTNKLQREKLYTFTVEPNGEYIYYAVPVGLGTVSFKVGGFEGGFEAPLTVSVTNSFGYTEDYYVYRSTNKVTGSITVNAT